jgi:hypothetical protein
LVEINIVNLIERWCLDVVKCSKTGYSVVYISHFTVVPEIVQFFRIRFMVLTQSHHSCCAHHLSTSSAMIQLMCTDFLLFVFIILSMLSAENYFLIFILPLCLPPLAPSTRSSNTTDALPQSYTTAKRCIYHSEFKIQFPTAEFKKYTRP